jgi:two-component system secretion response regulator SsrB
MKQHHPFGLGGGGRNERSERQQQHADPDRSSPSHCVSTGLRCIPNASVRRFVPGRKLVECSSRCCSFRFAKRLAQLLILDRGVGDLPPSIGNFSRRYLANLRGHIALAIFLPCSLRHQRIIKPMKKTASNCVLLANPHHRLSEGLHSLLATTFETVVMVADDASLLESARRLQSDLAVVDLGLSRGNGLEMVRRLRDDFPEMKLIIISLYDQSSVRRAVMEAGANGFVVKHAIATDLLAATDAVLAGQRYVSPEVGQRQTGDLS